MSRTFSTKSGSVESLKVSLLCGCREKARQIRCTVETDTPDAFAIERVLHCVASFGRVSSVVVTTSAIFVANPARRTRARLVGEAVQPRLSKASAPERHAQPRDAEPLGNRQVGQPFGCTEDDLRPGCIGSGDLPTPRPRLQFTLLSLRQRDPNSFAPRHLAHPSIRDRAQRSTILPA